jgi:hypothetical protein
VDSLVPLAILGTQDRVDSPDIQGVVFQAILDTADSPVPQDTPDIQVNLDSPDTAASQVLQVTVDTRDIPDQE